MSAPAQTTLPQLFAYAAQDVRRARNTFGPATGRGDGLARYVSSCLRAAKDAKQTSEKVTEQWRTNFDAYMGRSAASSEKQEWQADQRMSRVPLYVERFASSLRGFLDNAERLYDFQDPLDPENRIEGIVRPFVDYLLSRAGTSKDGAPVSFSIPIGTALKWGATKMVSLSVTIESGRIRVDAVDPEELYYDPTGRGLYRIREWEVDAHVLERWATLRDSAGRPIYNGAAIAEALKAGSSRSDEKQFVASQQTGEPRYDEGPERKTVKLREYVGTLIKDGREVLSNCVVLVANENWTIRGPEVNPFWHQQDWIVSAPILDVPGSIYGRSYVELFERISATFEELTNLLLDGINTTSIPAHTYFPEFLDTPEDLQKNGVRPGGAYAVKPGTPANAKPLQALETGRISDQVFAVWQGISKEEREAAGQNEISLGNLSTGEKTAKEVGDAGAGAQQMMLNIARDLEEVVLNRVISLVWLTGLQALQPENQEMAAVLGADRFSALITRRADFFQRRIALRVRAISGQMRRRVELQELLTMLQTILQNPLLVQEFLRVYSMSRLVAYLVSLFGVNAENFRKTLAEQQQDLLVSQLGAAAGQAQGKPPAGGQRNPQAPQPTQQPGQPNG